MRVDLKSLMVLAHEIKGRYMLTMREAMRIAWGKAKGFTHAIVMSFVTGREIYFASDSDEARKVEIGNVRPGLLGSQRSRI